jgi:molybdenum cofactor cytidylyltransferase
LPDGDRGLRDVLNADGADIAACDAPGLAYDIDMQEDVDEATITKEWLDPA